MKKKVRLKSLLVGVNFELKNLLLRTCSGKNSDGEYACELKLKGEIDEKVRFQSLRHDMHYFSCPRVWKVVQLWFLLFLCANVGVCDCVFCIAYIYERILYM